MLNNTNDSSTETVDHIFSVVADAHTEGRTAAALRILIEEKGMTLAQAIDHITPVRMPQVGDILSTGWGYEQTRYDFYQVVGVTKASVKIRKIAKVVVEMQKGPGCQTVAPVKDSFVSDKPLTKRFKHDSGRWGGNSKIDYSCKIESYATASLWDGKPEQESGDY